MTPYPLKFQPIFQKRTWGGQKLRSVLGKPLGHALEKEDVGESWELADLPPRTVGVDSVGANSDGSLASVITHGPLAGRSLHEAWSAFRPSDAASHFPLLIKILDARKNLSVQVHPDAAYAKAHTGAHLKSEAWYVLHAEPEAKIYKGLKAGVTREQFRQALNTGEVEALLQVIPVQTGDCHYLESGTVHALGAGILAAEVQTPSDTTFRVFDWNRLGTDGAPRKLHVKEALECINFDAAKPAAPLGAAASDGATRLVACPYFTIDRVTMNHGTQRRLADAMAIWVVLEGQGVVSVEGHPPTAFTRGDTLLLPAGMQNPRVNTIAQASWLESRVPNGKVTS